MILAGSEKCGFKRCLWTLPMVRELIKGEFGVDYHDDHLGRFLRRQGMSCQRPKVCTAERDEKAIKHFVQREFPAIEKKRGVGAQPSSSSMKLAI